MIFRVTQSLDSSGTTGCITISLVKDNWDDFNFKTSFVAYVHMADGTPMELGAVKIATRGMVAGRTKIPDNFDKLDSSFFSLGQTVDYYARLKTLPDDLREQYLKSVRDIVFNNELLESITHEESFKTSLLRDLTLKTIKTQFRRIATGGERHEAFSFSYTSTVKSVMSIDFTVRPGVTPPTNIHVLIGRNGVGKTRLLSRLEELAQSDTSTSSNGESLRFTNSEDGTEGFSNLITVAFSAFDAFHEKLHDGTNLLGTTYSYFGLKKSVQDSLDEASDSACAGADSRHTHKSIADIVGEFSGLLKFVLHRNHYDRFANVVQMLASDPLIDSSALRQYLIGHPYDCLFHNRPSVQESKELVDEFREMSSGHKIVLFTLAGLVKCVHEKTLVLIDEPETHLHPPLLSAFIRALSHLLIERNAVAIIATHSPVVLQEVPRSCVWKLSRFGDDVKSERPVCETFGENVGVLTSEVFGLETTRSGFFTVLEDLVRKHGSYDEAISSLHGQLGVEGRGMLRILFAKKAAE